MSNVQIFDVNEKGTDFICGDIHGMFDLLEEQLLSLGFDAGSDRLFALGDLIDRGEQSQLSIDYLQKPWFHSILGNHEQLAVIAMTARDSHVWGNWIANGGGWILDIDESLWPNYYESYLEMPLVIEIPLANGQRIGLVHAEMPMQNWADFVSRVSQWPKHVYNNPDVISKSSYEGLHEILWGRAKYSHGIQDRIEGIDHVFHGHTIVNSVRTIGNVSYIDTGSYQSQKLTVLNPQILLSQ
jgi:serine/threonine protein phosphatase 1